MRQAEFYEVDLGAAFGNELGGVRPVAVISDDAHNVAPRVIIVVIGADAAIVPATAGLFVPASESGAPRDVVLFPYQVRSLDPDRFTDGPVGKLPAPLFHALLTRFQAYIAIPKP